MTTDDKTPDPTPALLSAARLAAVRDDADTCREALDEGALDFKHCEQEVYDAAYRLIAEGTRDLLAHLAALTPRAGDGEVLGRRAWRERASSESRERYPEFEALMDEAWETQSAEERARYQRIGLALDAHGYARGLAAGEVERARLEADRDMWRDTSERALNGGRRAMDDRDATIARLTAERALSEELRAASEQHEREAAEARATVFEHSAAETDKRVATARLDGAREEREAIVERVRQLAAEGAPGMPEDGDETLVDWIATQIEGRATEGTAT